MLSLIMSNAIIVVLSLSLAVIDFQKFLGQ